MSKNKNTNSKNIVKSLMSNRWVQFASIICLGVSGAAVFDAGLAGIIIGSSLTFAGFRLYEYALEQERRAGQVEGTSSIHTLQKEKSRQSLKEKLRDAKERDDKLAYKSAVLEQASLSKKSAREAAVSQALKEGKPLSAKEVMKLRAQEEKKRLEVNKKSFYGQKNKGR